MGRARRKAQDGRRGKCRCKDVATREHVIPPWAISGARWAEAYRASQPSLPEFSVVGKFEADGPLLVRRKLWQNLWNLATKFHFFDRSRPIPIARWPS